MQRDHYPPRRRRIVNVGGIEQPLDRDAVRRFAEPADVAGFTVMVVAAVGIAINGVSAWLLMAGQKGDLNIRSAFAHMVADAAVSAAVVRARVLSRRFNRR